jgi:ubiquinone/menaquinone biosynthesis C-methylase UbiE
LSSRDVRERFARTAEQLAALQDERAAALGERVRAFVVPRGDERALDVGTGAGALALALAPLVREAVGVDVVPELLEQARARVGDAPNLSFVEGDATRLPFEDGSFDLVGTLRTLHHVRRPELVVAEIARVTRPEGRILVVDQIGPIDPLEAVELDRFERARDPSHARLLPDVDLRHLFEANELVLLRAEREREQRDVERYLDLAACEGEARDRARALAPRGYTAEIAWYLLHKQAK